MSFYRVCSWVFFLAGIAMFVASIYAYTKGEKGAIWLYSCALFLLNKADHYHLRAELED